MESPESMISPNIKKAILNRLKGAEQEHDVKIIFAVESGSRAWGFESPNSDYDVRFIYVHPEDWYLDINIENKRDVIEYEIVDEIDINGWDVRKALKLFSKSNSVLVEWLQSPIVYIDDGKFAAKVKQLIDTVYSIDKCLHHYRRMAQKDFREYLKGDRVGLKKCFYVLRSLLAIKWLEQNRKTPPMEFYKLRILVQDNSVLDSEISKLLEMKKIRREMDLGPPNQIINDFIHKELKRIERYAVYTSHRNAPLDALNEIFRENLR